MSTSDICSIIKAKGGYQGKGGISRQRGDVPQEGWPLFGFIAGRRGALQGELHSYDREFCFAPISCKFYTTRPTSTYKQPSPGVV